MKERDRRINLILNELKAGPQTINEIINKIWRRDISNLEAIEKGPKYYNHLNKLPVIMVEKKLIEHIGYKQGPSGQNEKVWKIVQEEL